jgi:hypothetical protein
MSDPRPEFSRLVPLARLGTEPFRQEIAAGESERAGLARRFGLVSLDRLAAVAELKRETGGTILLTAAFAAEFAQECVVTLEPVAGSVESSFALRYGPPENEPESDDDDGPAFEPLSAEAIDIGEAVAQEFSLCLPPFPRAPGAVIADDAPEAAGDGPFAPLGRLVRRETE